MPEIDRLVGARLRELRESLDMTVEALAVAVSETPARVTAYEQGWTRISGEIMVQLCRALNVSPRYFFTGYGCGR